MNNKNEEFILPSSIINVKSNPHKSATVKKHTVSVGYYHETYY